MDLLSNAFPPLSTGAIVLLCLFIIIPFIVACATCGTMASRLGRSSVLWVLLSIFSINPIVCIICLYGLGETNEHRKKRVMEEEEWKNKVTLKSYLNKE